MTFAHTVHPHMKYCITFHDFAGAIHSCYCKDADAVYVIIMHIESVENDYTYSVTEAEWGYNETPASLGFVGQTFPKWVSILDLTKSQH